MLRAHGVRRFVSVARVGVVPSSTRPMVPHVRAFVTPPDPTKPSSDPAFDSANSQKGGSSNTLLYLVAGTGLAAGAWYYMRTEEDPHAQIKEDEERLKKKAQELKEAGKQTAHDAVREGQNEYQSYKASGKEKVDQARASAYDARSQLDAYRKSAEEAIADATQKAEQKYADAKSTATATYQEAAHRAEDARQSWGQWFGSWFGYGKKRADDVKKESAAKVAEGARKVEGEAEKRT